MLKDNYDMRLVDVNFKAKDTKINKGLEIYISDSINTLVSENKKHIKVVVSRNCKAMPEEFFAIDIKYEKVFDLTEEAIGKLEADELDISDYVIENKEEYLTDVFSKISFILSFITNEIGVFPLITQGSAIEDEFE